MSAYHKKIEAIAKKLVTEGVLSKEQLQSAQVLQKETDLPLADCLVQQKVITAEDLHTRLAKEVGMSTISIANHKLDAAVLKLMTSEQVHKWNAIPVSQDKKSLIIAISDPFSLALVDDIGQELGRAVNCVLASP